MTNRETRAHARKLFGAALRAAREKSEITQVMLADELGLAQTQVSNYENGAHEPPPATVFEIERLVRVKGGTLATYLGYVPSNFRASTKQDTLQALLTDPTLGDREREAVINLYQTLSVPARRSSTSGRRGKISA